MRHRTRSLRVPIARLLVRAAIVPMLLSACDGDNLAPSPVATNIAVSSGAAQSGVVGTALVLPVGVLVTDQNGAAMPGVLVTFAPSATSGSVSATTVITDSNGIAQVQWTLGTVAGTDSLVANIASASISITATALPGVAAQIAVASGNMQTGTVSAALGAPLAVEVTDQFGNAVPNAIVEWLDDSGGSLSSVTATTDANGIAQTNYTLGASPGTDTVVAEILVNGSEVTTQFTEQGM